MAVIGRISIAPFARAHGVPATSWMTSFRSAASMMENPARGALESAKAPVPPSELPASATLHPIPPCLWHKGGGLSMAGSLVRCSKGRPGGLRYGEPV